MQQLVFEFDTEKECRDIAHKLWNGMSLTGEMSIRPLDQGRWRLEVTPERDLRESALEKFAAYRIDMGE